MDGSSSSRRRRLIREGLMLAQEARGLPSLSLALSRHASGSGPRDRKITEMTLSLTAIIGRVRQLQVLLFSSSSYHIFDLCVSLCAMEEERQAQALLWKHIYGFADSLTLKCAIELGIADIIHGNGGPMSLQDLAAALPLPTVNTNHLRRIMSYLVHMKLFHLIHSPSSAGEEAPPPPPKYALNPASHLILRHQDKSLASFVLLQLYEMQAWHHLTTAVEGKMTPWEKCHGGVDYREYFAKDTKANQLLSDAMTSHTSMVTDALVRGCQKQGILDGVASLVDVGGSTGVAARAVAKAFPHIRCAVFDLPHVIATAPECPEVERIEGDMFQSIPKADVVFMKSVLHDWDDEDCVKILKKCKEAIPENGKLVIVDIIMDEESRDEFSGARLGMQMDMLVTVGGNERNEEEWRRLIKTAGYSRYNITPIVAIESIIEKPNLSLLLFPVSAEAKVSLSPPFSIRISHLRSAIVCAMDAHLKDLFARFQEQFGSGPGLGPGSATCLLRVDGIPPAFLKSLFRAAAALYRTDPWKRFRPAHLFGLRVGKDSDWSPKKQPFPCFQFIGGDGGDLGLHMFRSDHDARQITGPRDTRRLPNVDILRLTFVPDPLLHPSNRRMVRSLFLEPSGDLFPVIDVARCCTQSGDGDRGIRFRHPTMEELRYVYAFMKAIALVHTLIQPVKEVALPKWRPVNYEPFIETVDVQWPPEVAKSSDVVAVTISHPPGQVYEEKQSSTPVKKVDPVKDESPAVDLKMNWGAPRQCSLCDKEVYGEQSVCCGRCGAVVYCGPVCQKQHWKDTHKTTCGLYKAMMEREEELAMKIFVFPCFVEHPCKWLESVGLHQKGMWRRKCSCYLHCPFGLLPAKGGRISDSWGGLDDGDYPPDSPFDGRDKNSTPILLSGWSEYYNLRSLPLSSPAAVLLSYPLTVYHILTALSISSKNLLLKGREVIVHYLGPEGELDWMLAFAEIGHLLNGSGNLQIVMVGPEIPSDLSGTTSGIGSRVRVNLVRGVYQEEATYLPSPHVVVALNSGLESGGSWVGALELIKSMSVPAFFTDQSEISCTNAKQVLRGAGLHITFPMMPNPFRSPLDVGTPFLLRSVNCLSAGGFIASISVGTMTNVMAIWFKS
ncbi:hypothetical protein ACLOJK_029639 [Asimina triloba]